MYFNYIEWFVHDLWYVECFALRWMICAKLNKLYLKRWMCFDYTERFALLLNDLNGSMKLPSGKYPPENCLETFSPWKSQQWTLPDEKTSLLKIPPVKTALQQIKKRLF